MTELQRAHRQKIILLVWGTLEVLLLAGPLYGWASLVVVLKHSGYFSSFCNPSLNSVTTDGSTIHSCPERDEQFTLIFSVAFFVTYFAASLPSGLIYDKMGPRPARFVASVLFAGSGTAMILSTMGYEKLLFVGTCMLAMGGNIILISSFQIANLFSLWGNTVFFLLNGAFDSSAAVLEVFKACYDAGVSLRYIYAVYYTIAVTSSLIFTFCFLPSKMIMKTVDKAKNGDRPKEEQKVFLENGPEDADKDIIEMTELDGGASVEKENGNSGLLFDEGTPVRRLILSSPFFWHVSCLSILQLRMWFLVGSLNPFLVRLSECDKEVSLYTDLFGMAQFSGIFFNLVVGLIMDEYTNKYGDKIHSFIVGFSVTVCTGIVVNIAVLIPNIKIQVITFFSYTALRGLCYSCYSSLFSTAFPLSNLGVLYSTGMLIAALIGSLQYALFVAVQELSSGDPFWLNVVFLCLTLVTWGHPLNLRRRSKKQRTS